jgi:hypothetical protein
MPAGDLWKDEERSELLRLLHSGAKMETIIAHHQRTGSAIVTELCRLGRLVVLPSRGEYRRVGSVFVTFNDLKKE